MQNEVGLDGIVYSTQGQATLNAVTDVISESAWWFIIVYCFFTVGSVKFLQLFVIFVGEELTAFGFETGEYEKTLRSTVVLNNALHLVELQDYVPDFYQPLLSNVVSTRDRVF